MLFKDLILKHKGKIIAIIGGSGKVTKKMVKDCKADVIISANEHGAKVTEVDYVVAMDDFHTEHKDDMRKRIQAHTDAPILGPFANNDVTLVGWPGSPARIYTGAIAIWVAWIMGAKGIVVLGMDGYQDEDGDAKLGIMDKYRMVESIVKCPIRIVDGGPLTLTEDSGIWEEFDKTEGWPKSYKPHGSLTSLTESDGFMMVIARKDTRLKTGMLRKGATQQVARQDPEVVRMLKHKMIVEHFED